MSNFIEKLRMNGIFAPGGGRPQGSTPFGMPDMNSTFDIPSMMANAQMTAQNENALDRQHELQLAGMKQGLPQIAKQMTDKPMNTVFNPGISEFQRGTLAGRAEDRRSRENIAAGRVGLGQEQIASREGMLDTRGNQVMDQIGARGDITSNQINQRGNIVSDQIDQRGQITGNQIDQRGRISSQQIQDRGRIQEGIQDTRGRQGLDQIAARGRESRIGDDSLSPGETKTTQDLAIRKLKMTDPELGPLVTIGTGGNIEISPEATPQQRELINGKIFARTSDVRLSSSSSSLGKTAPKKVKVTKGGKSYMLPENQVADATKQGYSVVK